MKQLLRQYLLGMGIDMRRVSTFSTSKLALRLISEQEVSLFYDIGANSGQFGQWLRGSGYTHQIVSCEPNKENFNELLEKTNSDPKWKALNCAVGGEHKSTAPLNISSNKGLSSSLLPVKSLDGEFTIPFSYSGKQLTPVIPIHELVQETNDLSSQYLAIKSDTQGFERFIFDTNSFRQISKQTFLLIIEATTRELYEQSWLIQDAIAYFYGIGFKLIEIEPEWKSKDGLLLEVNLWFINST